MLTARSAIGPVRGFTLLELLLVVTIIAIASAGVSFALRDSGQTQLEREAVRLAALLESGRARSQASGVAVQWRPTASGFVFEGLPATTLPNTWLGEGTRAIEPGPVVLGPEPVIGPQSIQLVAAGLAGRSLTVATDGVRPFAVQ
jgi:general secretion pathway protein H